MGTKQFQLGQAEMKCLGQVGHTSASWWGCSQGLGAGGRGSNSAEVQTLQRLHLWEKYKKTLDNLKYSEVSLNSSHTISRAGKDGQDHLAQPPTYHQCVSCSPNPAFPCMPWGALSASGWGPRRPEVLLHSDIWERCGDTSSTVNSSQKLVLFV